MATGQLASVASARSFFRLDQKPDFVGQLANIALTFLVLNSAAVVAFSNFLTGKKQVWVRLA